MKCDNCSKTIETKPDKRGTERIPQGWKRHQEKLWCRACWSEKYVMRAIAFPIAGIGLGSSPAENAAKWKEFRATMAEAWKQSTELANFLVTELAKADVVRTREMEKIPPAPKLYLYPLARARVPEMPTQSLIALLHAVQSRYNKARLETVWRGERALPTYRYPAPYMVSAQGWSAKWLSDGQHVPLISVRISDERIYLRLRGGKGFRRQIKSFAQVVSGDAIPGTISIDRVRGSSGDQSYGGQARVRDSGANVTWQMRVTISAWLPRGEKQEARGTMKVRRDKDAFLVAEVDGREPWVLHADHVRRWVKKHQWRLDRLSADTKYEKRWPAEARTEMNDAREMWCAKHQARIATWCHTASKMVVEFAWRQRVKVIEWEDGEETMLPDFPWFQVKNLIAQKAQERHIDFVSSGDGDEESPDGAREDATD